LSSLLALRLVRERLAWPPPATQQDL
jgi:hypothetical protein